MSIINYKPKSGVYKVNLQQYNYGVEILKDFILTNTKGLNYKVVENAPSTYIEMREFFNC